MTLSKPAKKAGGDRLSGQTFALLGVLTGGLSAVSVSLPDPSDALLFFAPGFIFGALFAVLLVRQKRLPVLRAVAWFACSTLAYTIAAMSVIPLSRPLEDLLPMGEEPAIALCGLIAGTLGGGLLASATRVLIPDTRWLIPTVAGSILGLALLLFDERMGVGTFGFYILWQAGYAALLARALPAGNCPSTIVTRTAPRN